MSLLLFLDLDGTLRRTSAPKYELEVHLVENLERFLASVRPLGSKDSPAEPEQSGGDDFQIVITSSWKDVFTLEEIRSRFPPGLRERIVGTTPSLEMVREHQRYREILAYLTVNGLKGTKWVAVDDQADLFPPGIQNLILCDPELGFVLESPRARY